MKIVQVSLLIIAAVMVSLLTQTDQGLVLRGEPTLIAALVLFVIGCCFFHAYLWPKRNFSKPFLLFSEYVGFPRRKSMSIFYGWLFFTLGISGLLHIYS